jgi:hypothetical protein
MWKLGTASSCQVLHTNEPPNTNNIQQPIFIFHATVRKNQFFHLYILINTKDHLSYDCIFVGLLQDSSSCILIWTCKLHWITAKLKKHKLSKCKSVNVLAQHFFTKIWKTELDSVLQFCSFCIFTHSQYSFCLAHHPFVFDGSGSWISSIQHSDRSIANWCEGFDAYFILTLELQDNPIMLISISA